MTLTFGPFTLDRERRQLYRDGAPVALTPKAFDLLSVLAENGGRVVAKETLMEALWPDTTVEESNLTFQISTLRKSLGDGRFIVTVPGRGYQLAFTPLPAARGEGGALRPGSGQAPRRVRGLLWLPLIVLPLAAYVLLHRRTPPPPPTPTAAPTRSIAVLPFKPIAATARDEALELGMADTLITRLSHVPGVVIRPISAVRRYTKLDQDPLDAGRELRVDSVVDGTIQRSGERMRVTVRLLRVADGRPLFAQSFDERVRDLFGVQDRVADGVARSLGPALSGREQQLLVKKLTNDVEAYQFYLKGRYWAGYDHQKALDFYQRALARDPRFAAAHAGIADALLQYGRYSHLPPREQFEKARAAAEKALALDPQLAEAHASLAQVYSDLDWNWQGAEEEYRRALALNANYVTAHLGYATVSLFQKNFPVALEHSRRGWELDPVSVFTTLNYGLCLRYSGQSEEAIAHLEELLRERPTLVPALLHLGLAHVEAGRPEIGMQKLQQAVALEPHSAMLAAYAFAAARAGKRDEALRIVREQEEAAKRGPVASPNLALAWTALGDHDRAFYWLNRAYEDRLYLVRMVLIDPGYDPLRSDPRYAELTRKMGL